jgi:hypothetical protein
MSSANSILLSLTCMHRSYMEQMTKIQKMENSLAKNSRITKAEPLSGLYCGSFSTEYPPYTYFRNTSEAEEEHETLF